MSSIQWSAQHLENFRSAAQSLNLYRRAELEDEVRNKSLIKDLYVDPLPMEHVFHTALKPNTMFLIGRKGTGKSTVFQRVQYELRHMKGYASAYVDIKTVFEGSATDPEILAHLGQDALSSEQLQKLQLYRAFIKAVITEIKSQLTKKLKESAWEWVKDAFTSSSDELFESLDELLERADKAEFTSVLGIRREAREDTSGGKQGSESVSQLRTTISKMPSVGASASGKDFSVSSFGAELKYGDVLMRVFNIKDVLLKLKTALNSAGIKHLYVFVDDFSELPEDAMRVIVDTLLAPLNNWSEELIKFKIAAYPGRVYYGQIDKTKVDEIYLDLYRLYGTSDVSAMEEKAIDFTKRLVNSRLQYFAKCGLGPFIESEEESIWKLLFYASMGNPRILGYLLYYVHESHLIYSNSVGTKAIRDASARYYDEKIEAYFTMNKFLHESFGERSSLFSLKELLEAIVQRARELRRHRDSAVMRELTGVPPTSHFHVAIELESLLATLELNFFLTKYYEMSDRDGHKVAVYALSFGLCQKYSVAFGRPMEKREHRLYFVERVFDYTSLLRNFIKMNQEIRCNKCNVTFELDKLDALKTYEMKCPSCKTGTCVLTNLSRKYESILKSVLPELLMPSTELGILQALDVENRPMFASEIAAEMDRSYQLVGKRAKMLADRGLVSRSWNDQDRRVFEITSLAKTSYFAADATDSLDLGRDNVDWVEQAKSQRTLARLWHLRPGISI
jgi:DNA-binding MarR family transcriptional regulator